MAKGDVFFPFPTACTSFSRHQRSQTQGPHTNPFYQRLSGANPTFCVFNRLCHEKGDNKSKYKHFYLKHTKSAVGYPYPRHLPFLLFVTFFSDVTKMFKMGLSPNINDILFKSISKMIFLVLSRTKIK